MVKKIILWFVTVCLLVTALPVWASNDDFDEIFIDFSESGVNNKLNIVSDKDISYETREGKRLVNISTSDGQLIFDIEDSAIKNPEEKAIEMK